MTGVAGHEGGSSFQVVVGVDTHQDKHVAVAIDLRGVRLGEFHTSTTTRGYEDLERWSLGLGEVQAFGIEGTVPMAPESPVSLPVGATTW